MRGGAQAKLIAADDGCTYVVKFGAKRKGGCRVLVNEFLGSALLAGLGIATPAPAFVEVGDRCFSEGGLLPNGRYFGSRYRGDTAIFDFLPKTFLHKLLNRAHFVGAMMFDCWTSNTDSRQAIFFRPVPDRKDFAAEMIDNDSLFGGGDWTFQESTSRVLYSLPEVYPLDLSIRDFAPWLDALAKLDSEVLHEAIAALPREWMRGDERAVDILLSRLLERRILVPGMIQQAIEFLRAGLNSPRVSAGSKS